MHSTVARALRIIALILALLGVAWDTLAALWMIFPGGSGEWTRLAVPAAYAIGVPSGLLSLFLLWCSGRSESRLRAPTRAAAGLAMVMPLMLSLMSIAFFRR
jgi:hypothetical protein